MCFNSSDSAAGRCYTVGPSAGAAQDAGEGRRAGNDRNMKHNSTFTHRITRYPANELTEDCVHSNQSSATRPHSKACPTLKHLTRDTPPPPNTHTHSDVVEIFPEHLSCNSTFCGTSKTSQRNIVHIVHNIIRKLFSYDNEAPLDYLGLTLAGLTLRQCPLAFQGHSGLRQ